MMNENTTKIIAPLSGAFVPLEEVPDDVFAQKMMGDGAGIEPCDFLVRSPISGTIKTIASGKHALSIENDQGLEILVHVGIDSVHAQGLGFSLLVKSGEQVKAGDSLLEFEPITLIQNNVTSLVSVVLVVEPQNWSLSFDEPSQLIAGETILFRVQKKTKMETESKKENKKETAGENKNDIIKQKVMVQIVHGIHARPAALFANAAAKFSATVFVLSKEKKYNGKSAVSLMSANIRQGQEIVLQAQGHDAHEALDYLATMLQKEEPKPAFANDSNFAAHSGWQTLTQKAIAAAGGEGYGVAWFYFPKEIEIDMESQGQEKEWSILQEALQKSQQQLQTLIENAQADDSPHSQNSQEIFQAHKTLVTDCEIHEQVKEEISFGNSAGLAWKTVLQKIYYQFANMDNKLLAERAQDILDIQNRVLKNLATTRQPAAITLPPQITAQKEPVIAIANDLTPSELMQILELPNIAGLCLVQGGATSHVAILAADKNLPMLVGCPSAILQIPEGSRLVVSAETATFTVFPTDEQYLQVKDKLQQKKKHWAWLLQAAQTPAHTLDNAVVSVAANAAHGQLVAEAKQNGAEEIGLVRTEFVFVNEVFAPSEEKQYQAYWQIKKEVPNIPVVFRTLDVGGDKPMSYLPLPQEQNPLMGLRGIRNTLHSSLFRTQVRAILRLSGKRKILLPMVSDMEELRLAKKIIEEERSSLAMPYCPVGIMVEVPATALLAQHFAQEADFFSIGSNDLSQYILAMDRTHSQLNPQAVHPAVLQSMYITAQAAKQYNIPVSLCGALASDPFYTPLLVGLGISQLSVVPALVPVIKQVIRTFSLQSAKELALSALKLHGDSEVQTLTKNFIKEHNITFVPQGG